MIDSAGDVRLDEQFLEAVGLGALAPEAGGSLLTTLYKELELRVGRALAEMLSDEQLEEFEEFEEFFDNDDESGGLVWLQTCLPGYRDTVFEEFGRLRDEVAAHSDAFLAQLQEMS